MSKFWMQTWSGARFDPLDQAGLSSDQIRIDDIAVALSRTCRFRGHCLVWYSVAEHSLLVASVVPPRHALAALLHDAAEAYLGDVPAPFKRSGILASYGYLETEILRTIWRRWGVEVEAEMLRVVAEADAAVLAAERDAVMGPPPEDWGLTAEPAPVKIVGHAPEMARTLFLAEFDRLMLEEPLC
ncbi:MAG: phosphohydrolase [Candidatus Bipolaricaulota bacterium]